MVEPWTIRAQRPVRDAWYAMDYAFHRLQHIQPGRLPKNFQRILVVELTLIGDIIVATPTLHALQKRYPKAKIDVLAFEKFRNVLDGNPDVHEVIGVTRTPTLRRPRELASLAAKLRQKHYDLAVVLHHGTLAMGILLKRADIPFRIGCVLSGMLKGKGVFLTHKIPPSRQLDTHVIEQNMRVLELLGIQKPKTVTMTVPIRARDRQWAQKYLRDCGMDDRKPIIAIHPGTRHPSHEWFVDRFATVADEMSTRHNAHIVFTGDDYDWEHFVKPIMGAMKQKASYAKTTLSQCAALLEKCRLLLSVDTGMIHVGAAVGVPVLGLYGSGKPRTWAPWGKQHRVIFNESVPCTGCRKATCSRDDFICMTSISTKQVIKALDDMLNVRRG